MPIDNYEWVRSAARSIIQSLKAIEAMIAKGADLDKPNDEGKSPRAYAEELGDEKVLRALGL